MKLFSLVMILVFLLFLLGCASRHTGEVKIYDPNGNLVKKYRVILDQPMTMKVIDGKITIEVDSRDAEKPRDNPFFLSTLEALRFLPFARR